MGVSKCECAKCESRRRCGIGIGPIFRRQRVASREWEGEREREERERGKGLVEPEKQRYVAAPRETYTSRRQQSPSLWVVARAACSWPPRWRDRPWISAAADAAAAASRLAPSGARGPPPPPATRHRATSPGAAAAGRSIAGAAGAAAPSKRRSSSTSPHWLVAALVHLGHAFRHARATSCRQRSESRPTRLF